MSQNIDDVRATDARRIVHARLLKPIGLENCHAVFRLPKQILTRAEAQAIGRASFDAGGLQPHRNAVGAQGAFVDLIGCRVEFGYIEGTTGHAVATTDAGITVEINDPVAVLNDRSWSRTRFQAARIHAMHALIFRHQPKRLAARADFIEFDQIPKIMGEIRKRLVGAFEIPKRDLLVVPLLASHFARLASDAGCRVDQLCRRLRGSRRAGRFAGCR